MHLWWFTSHHQGKMTYDFFLFRRASTRCPSSCCWTIALSEDARGAGKCIAIFTRQSRHKTNAPDPANRYCPSQILSPSQSCLAKRQPQISQEVKFVNVKLQLRALRRGGRCHEKCSNITEWLSCMQLNLQVHRFMSRQRSTFLEWLAARSMLPHLSKQVWAFSLWDD